MCNSGVDQAQAICGIFSLMRMCGQIGLDIRPGAPMDSIEMALKDARD